MHSFCISKSTIDEFLRERIKLFGDYEDAVTNRSNIVFHSALSPLINLGLITPDEIIEKLRKITSDVKFDIYGVDKVQPIWADHYFKTIANAKMGLNLSRGEAIKYYSSDRITQIIGNGLVCLIDQKTEYSDFFSDKEMVFYKSLSDLSEKISKLSKDEKLRKSIGKKGKDKYMKYFNSKLVAQFIIDKTLGIENKNKYIWHK